MSKENECLVVSDNGLACKKNLHHASNGEWWEHAGGHIFASEKTWDIINEEHVDATALLSGATANHHAAEDCTYDGFCAWRKNIKA